MSTAAEPSVLPGTRRALDLRLARCQADGRAPSVVAGVVRDGVLVWSGGAGAVAGRTPDAEVAYRIGSITKSFVAVLVLRLRDEGRLDLGDRLAEHLPDAPAGDRTLRQLLSHTAGIASETPPPWWERTAGEVRPGLADLLDTAPHRHPAGAVFHYSNVGYGLLGALVARLRGRPWTDVLTEEVLAPLGMTRTAPHPQPPHAEGWAVHPFADVLLPEPSHDAGLMAPAGQLWSTVTDLARYAAFWLDGGERVLAAATRAEMMRPLVPAEGGGYGLGLQSRTAGDRLLVGHGGSMPGFVAGLDVCEADGVGAVLLANATAGPAVAATVADLLATVADAEPRLPTPWTPLAGVDPAALELVGPWYWGASPLALRLGADRGWELTALGGRARETRLVRQPDGSFLGLDGYYHGERLVVVRDAAGAVSHLDLGSFVLTRQPYPAGDGDVPGGVVPGGVDPAGWRGRRGSGEGPVSRR